MELTPAQERACAPSLHAGATFGMSHCLLKLPMYGVSVVASAYSDVYESHAHSFMEALKSAVGAQPTAHMRRFGLPSSNLQIVDELCTWSAAEDKSRESERDKAMYDLQSAMYAVRACAYHGRQTWHITRCGPGAKCLAKRVFPDACHAGDSRFVGCFLFGF